MTGTGPGAGLTPILSGGLEVSGGDRRWEVQYRGADTPQQEVRTGTAGTEEGSLAPSWARDVVYEEVHQGPAGIMQVRNPRRRSGKRA